MATNSERSALTRQKLIEQARLLFARQGYAATGTEAILEAAGVKRGAMYHHFSDKLALFEAVCQQISAEAAEAIEAALPDQAHLSPQDQLLQGSAAWMRFVLRADIRQIMLTDAPTALGWARWQALEKDWSTASLQSGIEAAIQSGQLRPACSADLFTTLINGALNALALRASAPETPLAEPQWQAALKALWMPYLQQIV